MAFDSVKFIGRNITENCVNEESEKSSNWIRNKLQIQKPIAFLLVQFCEARKEKAFQILLLPHSIMGDRFIINNYNTKKDSH